MANLIHYGDRLDFLQMNNGLSSVFMSVLCLAGSDLAETEAEKKLLIWLAQRDQSMLGSGCIGFDICEMPFQASNFEAEKAFLIAVIEAALQKKHWDKLDYEPKEEWVLNALEKFKSLISELQVQDLTTADALWDFNAEIKIFDKCPQHGIYLHAEGCVICND